MNQEGMTKDLDVVTLGETMALFKAETPGPLAHAGAVAMGMGGAESNVAIALRRLGATAAWIGRLGPDSLGDLVVRELLAERVEVTAVRDDAAPTGLMVKERRTAESIKVWYYRSGSAGSRLKPADIPEGLIARARVLHLTGITPALSRTAAEAVELAVDTAKKAGTLVSFDLNYRAALWSREAAGPVYRNLISRADVVFAGDDEAAIAVGGEATPLELAKRLADLGPSQAVIKLGADGCVALIDGAEYQQAAIPVRAVDTVGAGDAFVAGYLSELLREQTVDQRLLTAVRTGAFACLVPGDWEGMPRRSELALLDAAEPVSR
jgi:2-dehydro-3-deoxygluconokinase